MSLTREIKKNKQTDNMFECLVQRIEGITVKKRFILIRKCNSTGQEFTSKSSKSLTPLTYLYFWDALGFFCFG